MRREYVVQPMRVLISLNGDAFFGFLKYLTKLSNNYKYA